MILFTQGSKMVHPLITICIFLCILFSVPHASSSPKISNIALLEFEHSPEDKDFFILLADSLFNAFFRSDNFKPLSYTTVNKQLKFYNFNEGYQAEDSTHASVISSFLAIDRVLFGSLSRQDGYFRVSVHFCNIESGDTYLKKNYTSTSTQKISFVKEIIEPLIYDLFTPKKIISTSPPEPIPSKPPKKKRKVLITTSIITGLGIAAAVPLYFKFFKKDTETTSVNVSW